MKYIINRKSMLSDTLTPVGIFMKLRNKYPNILLLESSDYSSKENSKSFLCFDTLEKLELQNDTIIQSVGNKRKTLNISLFDAVEKFKSSIKTTDDKVADIYNGIVGFTSFDAYEYFEDIDLTNHKRLTDVPLLRYDFFRFIIIIDHYYETLEIIENTPVNETSKMGLVEQIIKKPHYDHFSFKRDDQEDSLTTDKQFLGMVKKAKKHCQRGDVFQLVVSRRFKQKFKGDEFNVYRSLRSINPSPYLFYFDYGGYKIFGSSPEAQLVVNSGEAEIHPIAGTFKRSGNAVQDLKKAEKLKKDPKENAEHVMLVDLARNDLSRNANEVRVSEFKKVQFFSHVIHLVSVVKGRLQNINKAYQCFAESFPAGTLSGAPKYKAMELINKFEKHRRGFYGGCIGFYHLNNDFNHAIIIRSLLSYKKELHYQAGAGVVIASNEELELKEVNNKLGALRKAIKMAEKI